MVAVSANHTEKLLAVLLLQTMKKDSQKEKVRVLNLAGLSNVEIADLLDTTTKVVAQSLYEHRKTRAASPKRKTKATTRGK